MGMIAKQVGLLTLVATMGLAGCATTEQLEKVDNKAEQAANDAAAAQAQAADALRAANAAQADAAEAKRMAREAQESAANTEARIDRMFKKAMHK